jgi:hypothetical protein
VSVRKPYQPHRQRTFRLSTDPFSVEKVRDIVGLYLDPPDKALVLCVDEKSQVQALDRTQPMLPIGLGYVEGSLTTMSGTEPQPFLLPWTLPPVRFGPDVIADIAIRNT